MPTDQIFDADFSSSENKERLILELAGLRSQKTINEQMIRDQANEINRLKSLLDQHTSDSQKERKEAQWFLKVFENHPDAMVISRVLARPHPRLNCLRRSMGLYGEMINFKKNYPYANRLNLASCSF